jgi:hypothetical protein
MKGYYRFLRTRRGKCSFACVWVDVEFGGESLTAEDALPEQVDREAGEYNQRSAPTWVAAALEGIQAALAHARQVGIVANGCRVTLCKLVGSVIDTREDAIRCAAGLAVWDALGAPPCAPEAEFDGQSWRLVFPACAGNSAQGSTQHG